MLNDSAATSKTVLGGLAGVPRLGYLADVNTPLELPAATDAKESAHACSMSAAVPQ